MKKSLTLILLAFCFVVQAQDSTVSAKKSFELSGFASLTNNGISLIPTFSLNKPAAVFSFVARKNRFSFEPEFAFSLKGRPWYMIFWLRYKLMDQKRFKLGTGAHLGLPFSTVPGMMNGVATEMSVAHRYAVIELVPNYIVSDNFSLGLYSFYARGLEEGTTIRNTYFVTLNANVSNIKISKDLRFRITPQVYFLKQDSRTGYYFTSAFNMSKTNFPLSVSSIIYKKISSQIPSQDFIWNLSLVYSFGSGGSRTKTAVAEDIDL